MRKSLLTLILALSLSILADVLFDKYFPVWGVNAFFIGFAIGALSWYLCKWIVFKLFPDET